MTRKRKRPTERLPYRTPKQQRLDRDEAVEGLMCLAKKNDEIIPGKGNRENIAPDISLSLPDETNVNVQCDVGLMCKPPCTEKESQTETPATSDTMRLRIQNKILQNTQKLQSDEFKLHRPNSTRELSKKKKR